MLEDFETFSLKNTLELKAIFFLSPPFRPNYFRWLSLLLLPPPLKLSGENPFGPGIFPYGALSLFPGESLSRSGAQSPRAIARLTSSPPRHHGNLVVPRSKTLPSLGIRPAHTSPTPLFSLPVMKRKLLFPSPFFWSGRLTLSPA